MSKETRYYKLRSGKKIFLTNEEYHDLKLNISWTEWHDLQKNTININGNEVYR